MQIPRPLKLRQINATEGSKVHRFLAVAITGANVGTWLIAQR
jgi:hypothetical protein